MARSSNPLVSVIVPVYNVAKYIDECLKSILNQTYKNIEIILVDDASPDESGKKCDQWAQKDKRVKVIRKAKNEGLFQARITGFEEMTGDYFITVDSDDRIDSDFIKNHLDKALSSHADIVISDSFMRLYDNGDTEELKFPLLYAQSDVLIGLIKTIANSKEKFGWNVWGKMYEAKLYKKARKYLSSVDVNIGAGEDILLSFVFAHFAQKAVYLSGYAGYYYRQNNQSIMRDVQHKSFIHKIDSVTTVMFYAQQFLSEVGLLRGLRKEMDILKNYLISDSVWAIKNEYVNTISELQQQIQNLYHYTTDLRQQINNLEGSKAYRLGKAIRSPYVKAKNLLNHFLRQRRDNE